jgi:hypothetical protein
MHMFTCSEFHQALFEMKEMSRHCSFLSFPLILFSLVCLTTLSLVFSYWQFRGLVGKKVGIFHSVDDHASR